MTFSDYTKRYATGSFYIGVIRAAVDEYQAKHGGLGSIVVVATHISADDYTAQGHAESVLDGVIVEVERIANRKAVELVSRFGRQAALREQWEAGLLTDEQWEVAHFLSY